MPCELICPACGAGYYTAAAYHHVRGVTCDHCPRELVTVEHPGGLAHLPAPLALEAKRQERFDELSPRGAL